MRTEQNRWTEDRGWEPAPPGKLGGSAQLVFLFGSREILKSGAQTELIRKAFPNAHILGCSTAGEICGTQVSDDSLVTLVSTIIKLAHSLKLKVVAEGVETEEQSRLLRLLACDEMQGFLFSKPVPAAIFEARFLAPPSAG